ncbi:MAG: glutamate-1-semialdehyde 2,1-aminomutase [Dehalococcoidia bacterium]
MSTLQSEPRGVRRSQSLYQRSVQVIPGGVNSPVRSWRGVGGEPFFVARGRGSRIWDVDGNVYIDYVCSWGPLILGHAHPRVVEALSSALGGGTSFGIPTEGEVALAEAICQAIPSIEMVRLVNSGTEAAMSALRVARAVTGRSKVIKFAGCYHGHADAFLVRVGSGGLTLGVPDSAGVPTSFAQETLVARYNDLESVDRLFQAYPQQVAAVIVEPVAGNMGVIPPRPGFLQGLRTLTQKHGALLIFDEVITGFRLCYGGAQDFYQVKPDLSCLGKIIGGGMPVGAYGGAKEVMRHVAPLGPVYQAGTLSGNPLAVAAGLATLEALREPGVYQRLETLGALLEQGLQKVAEGVEIPLVVNRVGSMLSFFFTTQPVTDWEGVQKARSDLYARLFHSLVKRGVYIAPSPYEALFLSLAHSEEDIDYTIQALQEAFQEIRGAL